MANPFHEAEEAEKKKRQKRGNAPANPFVEADEVMKRSAEGRAPMRRQLAPGISGAMESQRARGLAAEDAPKRPLTAAELRAAQRRMAPRGKGTGARLNPAATAAEGRRTTAAKAWAATSQVAKEVLDPSGVVQKGLHLAIAAPGATQGVLGEAARTRGKGLTGAKVVKAAKEGAKRGASAQEYTPLIMPGASRLEQIAVGGALDLGLDLSNLFMLGGVKAGVGVGRGALALGRRTPGVARGIAAIGRDQEAAGAVRELAATERGSKQAIGALGQRVEKGVTRAVKRITTGRGAPTTPTGPAPKLTLDLAAARGEAARTKGTEKAARASVQRLTKQQKIRPRLPDATPGTPWQIPDVRPEDFRSLRDQMTEVRRLSKVSKTGDTAHLAKPYEDLAKGMDGKAAELEASPRLTQLARKMTKEKGQNRWNPTGNATHRSLQAQYDDQVATIESLRQGAANLRAQAEMARTSASPLARPAQQAAKAMDDLKAVDKTETAIRVEAKKPLDKAASLRSETGQWRTKIRQVRENPRYLELKQERDYLRSIRDKTVFGRERLAKVEKILARYDAQIAEYHARAKDAERAAHSLTDTGMAGWFEAMERWRDSRLPVAQRLAAAREAQRISGRALNAHLDDLGRQMDAVQAKYATQVYAEGASESLALLRARPVLGRIIGKRAVAETNLGRLQTARQMQGRVPVSQKGVNYRVPQSGEAVTEEDVRNLIGSLAERASLSGLALTPMDAERELLGHAASLGLNTAEMVAAAGRVRGMGRIYVSRILSANVKTWEELEKVERDGGYLRRIYGRHLSRREHLDWLRRNGLNKMADRLEMADLNAPTVVSARGKAPVRGWNPRANISVKGESHVVTPEELSQNLGARGGGPLPPGHKRLQVNIDRDDFMPSGITIHPPAGQAELEPITDVISRLHAETVTTQRILPRMELLQSAARDARLASDIERPGWKRLTSEDFKERVTRLRDLGYDEMADALEKESLAGGWGELTNKWVHPRLYFALNPQQLNSRADWRKLPQEFAAFAYSMLAPASLAHIPMSDKGAWGYFNRGFGTLKNLATVKNPVAQGFNTGGNWSQTYLSGVPAVAVVPLYAVGMGDIFTDSNFLYQVVKRMPSLLEHGALADVRATAQLVEELGRKGSVAKNVYRALEQFPDRVWQMNEVASKLAVVRWHHQVKKMPLDDAVRLAETFIYDYNNVPRWIEQLRHTPFAPFPTYAYKTAGLFTNALFYHPRRLNFFTRAQQAVEAMTPEYVRELEAQATPEWEKDNLGMRWPGRDKYGRAPYPRLGRALPWGSIASGDLISGRSPFMVGPVIEAFGGKDRFGRDIYTSEASTGEKVTKGMSHVGEAYFPPVRLWKGLVARPRQAERELANATSPGQKRRVSIPQTPLEYLTRTYPLDVEKSTRGAQYAANEALNELRRHERKHAREKGYEKVHPRTWPDSDPEKARVLRRREELKQKRTAAQDTRRKYRALDLHLKTK